MSHPNLEELLLAQEAGQEQSEARLHLAAGCSRCAQRLERAQSVLVSLSSAPLPEVPEHWIQRALSIAREESIAGEDSPGLIERARMFVAKLIEDSRQGAPALALRGAGLANAHLLYRAGAFDVDLAHLADGCLVGQVLPADTSAPPLDHATCLLAGGVSPRVVPLGDLGDFRFIGVQPGDYALLVETPETAIVIQHIRLQCPDTGLDSIDGRTAPYDEDGPYDEDSPYDGEVDAG